MNKIETATVVAALLHWAKTGIPSKAKEVNKSLANVDEVAELLTTEEQVLDLMRRIADGENHPTAVIDMEGGLIQNARANAPVRIIVLDADIEGADEVDRIDGQQVVISDYRLTADEGGDVQYTTRVVDEIHKNKFAASRSDIQFRNIGCDDLGIDGYDQYILVWSSEDDLTEQEAHAWCTAKFHADATPYRGGLSHVEVLPTKGSKHVVALSYRRDV